MQKEYGKGDKRGENMFNANKNKLVKKISKIQFVLHDIGLFLNTHPNDVQAIKHYEFYYNKFEELNKEYERLYGAPKEIRGGSWQWLEGPWPWEREFNEI
jgi:spore coat protein JB